MYNAHLFIGGEKIERTSLARFAVINPANEDVLGEAPSAGAGEAAGAVDAAQRALLVWRSTSAFERSNVLRRVAALIRERLIEIATLTTLEVGKPLAESRVEVTSAAEYFEWAAEETRRIASYSREGRAPESRYDITYEPVGVVLALTAWNYPVILPARKLAMALAAGCTVIVRPAEEAPGCATALVQCCQDAGLPAGAVNLLLGAPEAIVEPLMANPSVRKVSFTGSVRVGRILIGQSAQTVKRLTMELGGHAPFVVLKDADMAKTVAAATFGKFRNTGQVCTAPSRFYVESSVYDEFTEKMAALARAIRVGDGMEEGVQMGPLTTKRQRDQAERLVEDARKKGAKVVCGGARPRDFNRGYFYEPTILTEVPPDASIMSDEPFTPIAAVIPFRNVDDAVRQANSLEAGLAAYVFSRSTGAAEEVAARLEAGVIGINTVAVAAPEAPFGGVKASGFGSEGGAEGVGEYLTPKFVHKVRVS